MRTMPFGRYKGWRLAAVPTDYLCWLAALPDLRAPLRRAVEHELWVRGVAWEPPPTAPAPPPLPPRPPAADLAVAAALVAAGRRALARQHHPDAGGDAASMARVNATADWLVAVLAALGSDRATN